MRATLEDEVAAPGGFCGPHTPRRHPPGKDGGGGQAGCGWDRVRHWEFSKVLK